MSTRAIATTTMRYCRIAKAAGSRSRLTLRRPLLRNFLPLLTGLRKPNGYRLPPLPPGPLFAVPFLYRRISPLTSLPELCEYLRFFAAFFPMAFSIVLGIGRIKARALGDRPALERAIELEPEVVMQAGRLVLLNQIAQIDCARTDRGALRLVCRREVALGMISLERRSRCGLGRHGNYGCPVPPAAP